MMSKPQLEKWQQVNKAFPTEPGIDWSKAKPCEFIPKHKPKIIMQPFKIEQVPDKLVCLEELEKENE